MWVPMNSVPVLGFPALLGIFDPTERPADMTDRGGGAVEASMSSVTERLRAVVARTFSLRIEEIDDATTPAAVAAWDSLGQIDLVTALEQEFSVEFGLDEIMLMNSVGEIRSILERRNGAHG